MKLQPTSKSVIWVISLIGCGCVLFVCGCTTSQQAREEFSPVERPGPAPELTGIDAAVAEAIRYFLNDAAIRNESYRKAQGTLVLAGVNADVTAVIREEFRDKSARIETDRTFLHEFKDTRSGKPAWIIGVRILSGNFESAVIEIGNAYASLGAEYFKVELRKSNRKWAVEKFTLVAVS